MTVATWLPAPALEVRAHRGRGDQTVIEAVGAVDGNTVGVLREALLPAVCHGTVVLDCSRVRFLARCGLHALAEADRAARVHGAAFRLAAPSPAVMLVLATLDTDALLDVYPDVLSALRD